MSKLSYSFLRSKITWVFEIRRITTKINKLILKMFKRGILRYFWALTCLCLLKELPSHILCLFFIGIFFTYCFFFEKAFLTRVGTLFNHLYSKYFILFVTYLPLFMGSFSNVNDLKFCVAKSSVFPLWTLFLCFKKSS